MPITPYNAPIQYEYKPLNLSSFAVPLAKMQEDFDVATAKVGEADFDLAKLPYGTDPEKAKKLKELVTSKRDELAKNLAETKNYKAATSKIKELQTLWSKDPEKLALESNYKLWQERDKAERERIDSGKDNAITRDQYLQWKNEEIYNYGTKKKGASFKADYNNEEGDYNIITGQVGRLADLSDDFEKTRIEIAKLNPEQATSYFVQNGVSLNEDERVSLQKTIESKDAGEIARETEKYLRRIPKYRDWGSEVARYNFNEQTKYGEDLAPVANEVVSKSLQSINAQIKQEEKNKNYKTSEDYLNLVDLKEQLETMKQTGEYDNDVVKGLYTQQHLNKLYNSEDIADILAYRNVKTTGSVRKNYEWEAKKAAELENLKNPPLVSPTGDMEFNASSIQKNIFETSKGLHGVVTNLHKLGNGIQGHIVMGDKAGQAMGKAGDFAGIYARDQAVYTAAVQAKDAKTFARMLKEAGMNPSSYQANELFKMYHQPGSTALRSLGAMIDQGRSDYESHVAAKENFRILKETASTDEDFKKYSGKIGGLSPLESGGLSDNSLGLNPKAFLFAKQKALGQGSDKTPLTKQEQNYVKVANLFDANSYSDEALAKIGIKGGKKSVQSNVQYGINYKPLTFDQVAKLRGYKNYGDAVLKGYNFGNVDINTSLALGEEGTKQSKFSGITGTSQQVATQFLDYIGKKNTSSQTMAFELLNSAPTTSTLKNKFESMEKVLSYAGANALTGKAGFDENGNPEEGTTINITTLKVPKLVKLGTTNMYSIPYKYKGGEGTLYVSPAVGDKEFIAGEWNRVRSTAATGSEPRDKETFKSASVGLFDTKYPNEISATKAESLPVSIQSPARVVGTFIGPNSYNQPTTYSIVKNHPSILGKAGAGDNQEFFRIKADGQYFPKQFTTIEDAKNYLIESGL
jgi:hypothetical protein